MLNRAPIKYGTFILTEILHCLSISRPEDMGWVGGLGVIPVINNLFVTSGQGGERTRITGNSTRIHLPLSYWVTVLFVTVTDREEDRKLMTQSGCYLRWLINDRNIKFLASASPYAGGWQEASAVSPSDVNNQFPSQQSYLENSPHLSPWLFI
jgi:hypothetical protein